MTKPSICTRVLRGTKESLLPPGEQRPSQNPPSKTQDCLVLTEPTEPFTQGLPGSQTGPLLAWELQTGQLTQPCPGLSTSHPDPPSSSYPALRNGAGVHFPRAVRTLPRPTETWNRALGKGDKPSTERQARGTSQEATPSSLGPLNLVKNRITRSSDTVSSSFPQIRMHEAQKSSEPCPRSRDKSELWIFAPPCHRTALHPSHLQ